MMEDEPIMHLEVSGRDFEGNRTNMSLFTFVGHLAVFNHVFVMTGINHQKEEYLGAYCFSDSPSYELMKRFIEEHNFPQHLNMNQVPDCDRNAWIGRHTPQMDDLRGSDYIPEDWQ